MSGSAAVRQAMSTLVQQAGGNPFEKEYDAVTRRAIGQESVVSAGLGSGSALGTGTEFASFAGLSSNNRLAARLELVARLIAARNGFGVQGAALNAILPDLGNVGTVGGANDPSALGFP